MSDWPKLGEKIPCLGEDSGFTIQHVDLGYNDGERVYKWEIPYSMLRGYYKVRRYDTLIDTAVTLERAIEIAEKYKEMVDAEDYSNARAG